MTDTVNNEKTSETDDIKNNISQQHEINAVY